MERGKGFYFDKVQLGVLPLTGMGVVPITFESTTDAYLDIAHPPSASIVRMMGDMVQSEYPFLSISNIIEIFGWLKTIFPIKTTYPNQWGSFDSRSQHVSEEINRCGIVASVFLRLANAYHTENKGAWVIYTQEEWIDHLYIPRNMTGVVAKNYIEQTFQAFFIPFSRDNFPSKIVFDTIKRCASMPLSLMESYGFEDSASWIKINDPALWRRISKFQTYYGIDLAHGTSNVMKPADKNNPQRFVDEFGLPIRNSEWTVLYYFLKRQYAVMLSQYPSYIDSYEKCKQNANNISWAPLTNPMARAPVTMIEMLSYESFYSDPSYCFRDFKVPDRLETATMSQVIKHVHNDKIEFIMLDDMIEYYSFLSKRNAIFNRSEFDAMMNGLRNVDTKNAYLNKLSIFMSIYMYYVQIVQVKSENFSLNYNEWSWNEKQQTEKEKEQASSGNIIPDTDNDRVNYIISHWPKPWTLSEEDFLKYMEYAWPMPQIRDINWDESPNEYGEKKRASIASYLQWHQLMVQNRNLLLPEKAIGCPVATVEHDGKFVTVYNFYLDFGVWKTEEKTFWQQFVYVITGAFAFDIMMDRAKRILNLILDALKGVDDVVSDFIQKNSMYLLAFGALGIVALKTIK